MGAAFTGAALIPIIPHLIIDGNAAIVASIASALAGLFILGALKGRLVERPMLWQGVEILIIGAAAAGLALILGEGLPRLF